MKWLISVTILFRFGGLILASEIEECKNANEINGTLTDSDCLVRTQNSGLEDAVDFGWKLAVNECAHQFRWSRWNCSINFSNGVSSPVAGLGTRESGYISAITSAGIVYSIARACARGNISTCGCAPPTTLSTKGNGGIGDNIEDNEWDSDSKGPKPGQYWRWGGCSADVDYAVKLARKNMPQISNGMKEELLRMNFHNEKVGRNLIQQTLDTDCKCHGVSGSCTLKTCWLKLPTFRTIAEKLTDLYKQARLIRLELNSTKSRYSYGRIPPLKKRKSGRMMALTSSGSSRRLVRKTELVYILPSPNYCDEEVFENNFGVSWSWMGTHGRRCLRANDTQQEEGSCDILCCGRGYNTHQVWRRWKCHCQFRWCCDVHCLNCQKMVDIYTCN